MKEGRAPRSPWGEYPYIVKRSAIGNLRYGIVITNEEPSERLMQYMCWGEGAIDAAGQVTDAGRALVAAKAQAEAAHHSKTMCVVWAPDDCTYFMPDGSARRSQRPPAGQPVEAEAYDAVPVDLIDGFYVEFPYDGEYDEHGAGPDDRWITHIFIRRVAADLVEVSPARPMTLGNWDERIAEGAPDPFEQHFDENGVFVAPATFRGVPVHQVTDSSLLGPVQPAGIRRYVVAPWPEEVFKAAEQAAERPLPQDVKDAIWRAVEPPLGMMYVGALAA